MRSLFVASTGVLLMASTALPGAARQDHGATQPSTWSATFGGGWTVLGMAQAYPIVTFGDPGGGGPLDRIDAYLTQPVGMANLESPSGRWVLRTTLNYEGMTLPDGESTFGLWGEGYLDKRHPHTFLHELMLSLNAWATGDSDVSVSLGKGFAPYGTDDPMSRPGLKFPTNHHLSQIPERWLLSWIWRARTWSVEAGIFGGAEPEGPYDSSNIRTFGDSWSLRLVRRWTTASSGAWELSASHASVREFHHGTTDLRTRLWNVAGRAQTRRFGADIYALVEASRRDANPGDGHFSVLAETRVEHGRHRPYARFEVSTRPEYERLGGPTVEGFFRYDHHAAPLAASRWVVTTIAYEYQATGGPLTLRPFVEMQHHFVNHERGVIDPTRAYGGGSIWAVSAGARLFLGGGPMRMGSYGALDPMTRMRRVIEAGRR